MRSLDNCRATVDSRWMLRAAALALMLGLLLAGPTLAARGALDRPAAYKNGTALNKYFKHGIGRVGAPGHTTGTPVTSFQRNNRLYRLNRGLDGVGTGIGCEML